MQFSREERYYILKISDMRKYLGVEKQEAVRAIAEKLNAGRIVDKKNVLQAVVVESDWPEYDAVWDMIEARVTGALKLKGPTEEESVGPADTASNRHAISKDLGSSIAIMQRMQRHINELIDRERGMLDAEAELNCAEEVLDGYAAHLNLKETHFDCVGDYIKGVCEALRADRQRILRVMSLLASMPSLRSFFEEFKELEQKNGR